MISSFSCTTKQKKIFIISCGACFGLLSVIVYMEVALPRIHTRHRTYNMLRQKYKGNLISNKQGTNEEKAWLDFHQEYKIASVDRLYNKVKVLCWVLTTPFNFNSKAKAVKLTWGKHCNKLLFMSSTPDPELPAIGLHIPEGRNYLWGKTKAAFQYLYDNHLDDADWFLKADDDTYVVVENLRYMLQNYSSNQSLCFGRKFKPHVLPQGYMSGGAGYVISKNALKQVVTKGLSGNLCKMESDGAEDLQIGECLQSVQVKAGDSRDNLKRERFHPLMPELHLVKGLLPADSWYWSYNYYYPRQGSECCSDSSVSFHYIKPYRMYALEYYVYHLKLYGTSSFLVRKSTKEN